jgi:ribosome maturation factor RimP
LTIIVEGPKAPQLLYMNVEKELNEILSGVLEKYPHVFAVEARHSKQNHELIIDGDQLLGIYDIAEISREVNRLADERMPDENYSLEIASPGADSPILLLRQYPKHIGREFMVHLIDGNEFKGRLKSVDGNTLTFESFKNSKPKKNEEPEAIQVEFEQIKKAHIIISFK